MGGFHVIPIYGAKGYESKYLKYLSPEWMQAFRDAVEIGAKHGLGVDMTMGNGWCFGGPQLKPEQGCWKLEKTPDGKPPYVTWKLTGQKVKRAGPGGKGPMMDPYSTEAIDAFLAPYAVFDAPGVAKPQHVYHDSWEYFQAGWSPALFDAFKAKRGYDLRDHLKELAGIGEREEVGRIRCDYRETLSDLVIDDVFPRWADWAHRHGIRVRNEGHGTCANWLDFYALADCPETEMFSAECRDILVSKFASSAAHVTGKKYVSSESCTWLGEHFTETLQDFKVFIDRLLLSGVNHMFYHGCCYSPVDAVWPGWCFYASCEMNPRNPVWRDAKYLNAYVGRVQAMFQACEPDNDTLVYWPLRDYWWEADGFERMMSVHNATNWFHAQPIGAVARRLAAEGVCFDYVSDRQLQRLDLSRYAKIEVPPCRHMPEATKAAVAKFRTRPVRVEPYAAAGLAFSRYRRGDETVYFIVNTNATRFAGTLTPTAVGAKWWMDPMTGDVRPTDDRVELEAFESGFLVVKKGEATAAFSRSSGNRTIEQSNNQTILPGPWTLTPVCGGPELPPVRTMARLTTWSRNADGSENPFSGTMRYRTEFDWTAAADGEATLDLGAVSQSARVRINGWDVGFAILAPYRVRFSASVLKKGKNVLEVEVTSTGANRIRWNDRNGVKWKYFTDANVIAYGYKGALDATNWPLREYGLFGPVRLSVRAPSVGSDRFKAGYAKIDITPPLGTPISGYYVRRVSNGVLDPLHARCLALSDGTTVALVYMVDNLHLPDAVAARVKAEITRKTGVPAEAIFLAATHIHTGPNCATSPINALPEDVAAVELSNALLASRCADCGVRAIEDLAPAKIRIGRGEAKNISFVRRFRMKDGTQRTNPPLNDPNVVGPIGEPDEQLQLVRFVRTGAKEIDLVNFQTHPDVIGGTKFSADWPGLACDCLEGALGGKVHALLINGAQGDTNHCRRQWEKDEPHLFKGYELSQHLSRVVAAGALAVWSRCHEVPAGKVGALVRDVKVRANKGTPEEYPEAERIVALHKAGRANELPQRGMDRTTAIAGAYRVLELRDKPDEFVIPVAVISIGQSVAIGGFPGEPFTWMGTEMKRRSPFALTVPSCCANGSRGYFPVESAYIPGGYENSTSRYAKGTAERLTDAIVQAMESLYWTN